MLKMQKVFEFLRAISDLGVWVLFWDFLRVNFIRIVKTAIKSNRIARNFRRSGRNYYGIFFVSRLFEIYLHFN